MRWLVIILVGCLALTVLKSLTVVLLLGLLLGLLWAICFRPRELLAFGALMLLGMVLQEHGLAVLVLVGLLGFIALVRRPVSEAPPADAAAATLLLEAPAEKQHSDST